MTTIRFAYDLNMEQHIASLKDNKEWSVFTCSYRRKQKKNLVVG